MVESWWVAVRWEQIFEEVIMLGIKLWRDRFHLKVDYQGDVAGMSLLRTYLEDHYSLWTPLGNYPSRLKAFLECIYWKPKGAIIAEFGSN